MSNHSNVDRWTHVQKRIMTACFSTVFISLLHINTSLPYAGPPSRDQGPRLLCPSDTPSFCTWRWPASVPLLHHPLTVEGQGGPPLSTGPAALIWAQTGWERAGGWGRCRGEEGLDPLAAPDHWSIHRLIAHWSLINWTHPSSPLLLTKQRCGSPRFGRGGVGGKNMDGSTFPPSVSFSLSHCKDKKKNRLSILLLTPLTPHLWAHLDTWKWVSEQWNYNTSCSTKKIKIKSRYCHLWQLFALCGVSSQPITWHLCVTILWFILLWPISTQHGRRAELDCGKHRSPGY